MKSPIRVAASLLCLASLPALSQAATPAASAAPPNQPASAAPKPTAALQANYGKLPLSFEANQGQADPQAKFTARGQGYSLYLTDSAAVLALTKPEKPKPAAPPKPAAASGEQPTRVPQVREANLGSSTPKTDLIRMELAGANPAATVAGADPLPGKANYFLGNDPAKWHSNVPTYAKVKYAAVYPGVDLLYYGNQSQLEYDFVLAPGADPNPVKLRFAGANKLKLDPNGDLTVLAKHGQIAFHKPVVYQTTKEGRRQPIEGSFALLANDSVAFKLGPYDHNRELVIDPVLAYSTYLGGSGNAGAHAIAVDAEGSAYVIGQTTVAFPLSEDAFQKSSKVAAGNDTIFVAKLNPAGSALAYSTYLGGSATIRPDRANAIAVDSEGEAYVAGSTGSTDFPVTSGALQPDYPSPATGYFKGFVTKLNAAGSGLVYSTYLGGTGPYDEVWAIAVDAGGDAYVTGLTFSKDFPITPQAFQTVLKNGLFVAKFNPEGSALIYSTFLGGTNANPNDINWDAGFGIAVDDLGQAYVTGKTYSLNFPVTSGAFQQVDHELPYGRTGKNLVSTGFVTKFNAAGSALIYSTYLGGSNNTSTERYGEDGDDGYAIAIDAQGDAYVTGSTYSKTFPVTKGAFQRTLGEPTNGFNPSYDAFVTKLNPAGSALVYSTYLGGGYSDSTFAIAVDALGRAVIVGSGGEDIPVTPDAYQGPSFGTTSFFTMLNETGSALVYSTYFGTNGGSSSMALDSLGNAYLAGVTGPNGIPVTPGAYQSANLSAVQYGANAFVSKFAFAGATATSLASSGNPQAAGASVTFDAHVAPVAGTDVPSGSVSFIVDGVVADHEALDGTGDASYSTSSLAAGPHTVVASYLGDPAAYSASSGALTQTIVGQASAPTFVPLPGTYRGSLTVSLESASPGATIYYATGGGAPTTSSAVYTGPMAVAATTTISAIAVEAGGAPSAVATATYTVTPPSILTKTTVQSSLNPSTAGQSVTFTATVAAASGPTPTGSVTFKHGSTIMGSAPLVGGVAQLATSTLAPEGYEVLAVYTGNATDAESYSPSIVQIVNP